MLKGLRHVFITFDKGLSFLIRGSCFREHLTLYEFMNGGKIMKMEVMHVGIKGLYKL